MLLKFNQSEDCSCPVLREEANGRLMVKELVEVEMLKMLPAVPVETLAMMLLDKLMEVEVPIKTFCPPLTVKRLVLAEVREANVLVPVPPFNTGRIPETWEPKATWPL